MKTIRELWIVGTLVTLVGACASDSSSSSVAEDERGSVGVPNPAHVYCENTGYTATNEECAFPDGSSCEQWSFFRGECGQSRSYCHLNGGSVSTQRVVSNGGEYVYAVCDLNGKRCVEDTFAETGKCE